MADFPLTEQEERLEALFSELRNQLRGLESLKDVGKQNAVLEGVKGKIQDAKALIKEFEREARTDGIPSKELSKRKTEVVNELNNLISMRKTAAAQLQSRQELLNGAQNDGGVSIPSSPEHMSTQQIVATGRKEIQEIDTRLSRAEKVVDDTIQIGVQTAAELAEQTKQMEKIVDDLDDIEFNMKKARLVLRDITRGLLTDKFIMFICVLIAVAVVVVIVMKVVDKNDDSFPKPRELGGNRRLQSDLGVRFYNIPAFL